MIISDFSIKNRSSIFVFVAFIILFGLYSYVTLPRESTPDIKIPYVFISTDYRGVAAKDIETSVTIPIEKKLKGLKNVKKIQSSSTEGLSSISVEFTTETDIDDALQWVKDKVDTAKRDLPTDLEDDPSVFEVNLSEQPVVVIALHADFDLRKLKKIAEELEDAIEAIPGVLEVDLVGGKEREIHIEIDPDLLAAYRVPFEVLFQSISSGNQNVSGGNIAMGDGRYQIRVPGEFKTIEEFQNLMITVIDGSPVYLRDIATIKDSYKDVTSESKFNFKNSINLYVKKRAGENIIVITDAVKEVLKQAEPHFPKGLTVTKLMDRSDEIRMMIADLENNIITGLILVILVLMFAMGLRNAIMVSTAIPLSMLLSFIILRSIGINLNMITLFSLILALGMLVDNAIVIVENVFRFMQQGVPRMKAAMKATSEVAIPVIGSAMTTIVAFFPLIFWTGLMGEFMKFLPITLMVTLFSSLVVAMMINPVFCSVFMKAKGKVSVKKTEEEILRNGEKPVEAKGRILTTYQSILKRSLKSRAVVILSSVLLLLVFINLWKWRTGVERPVEFFPSVQPAVCYINIDPPQGMDMDSLREIAKEVEKRVQSYENVPAEYRKEEGKPPVLSKKQKKRFEDFLKAEGIEDEIKVSDLPTVRFIYTKLSSKPGGQSFFEDTLPNHIGIQFYAFNGRVEATQDSMKRIRARLDGIPGADIYLSESQEGPPTGAPINIEISGDDFYTLGAIAQKMKEVVKKVPYVHDIEDNYVEGAPTIELIVDKNKSALFGLKTVDIGNVIKTAFSGWNVSTYREQDEDYDVFVKASKHYRENMDILRKLFLPTPSHGLVPISDLVTIKYVSGLGGINRIDHKRVVTVKAQVDETKIPGASARMIAERMLKTFEMPSGYTYKFTGENEFQKDSEEFLSIAFVMAICLIFTVLVLQFNSVVYPFIILFSVVISMGGVYFGLFVADIPFGIIMTGLGVISLAGIVVNNAIVLLDYMQKLIDRGYSLDEAVIAGGTTRFRPVILTAITTVLGLLPMITGVSFDFKNFEWVTASESQQWWFSMAIAVAFGLVVATILTLIVVPVVFHLLTSMRMKVCRLLKTKNAPGADALCEE